ncbi:MAG TPA: permease [Caulobacteraceae bacterium]|nr:permease [Caulobacteraceae bacterium]
MTVIDAVLHALLMAAEMGWLLLWPLILGFAISGAIQAVVSHSEMAKLLPDDRPASVLKASLLGAASSSCSYAAVAIARSMIRKGADFRAAMAFQFASTNLVIELGLILAIILGWRFTAATWAGGVAMIVILTVLLRLFVRPNLIEAAKRQAEKGIAGRMEGHAEMDMSVSGGPLLKRLFSERGFTAVSHYFVMDWASVWIDLIGGLLIAGALAAWVPNGVWASLFFTHDPTLAKIVGPLLGPLIAVASFVCSVGNVPLAAVLWNGGASFGGVIAFIFADLIVLPILDIYRRYYGLKPAAVLFVLFYTAMALAGYLVQLAFDVAGLVPQQRAAQIVSQGFAWNYTTFLNLGFLVLAALLVWRFLRTGGPAMLARMN